MFSKVSRNTLLVAKRKEGPALSFFGVPESQLAGLRSSGLGSVDEASTALSGHNWGKVDVDGASAVFRVGGKPAFVMPLPDVAQVQQGRDEVILQFPVDDTAAFEREDTLVEVSFHIPKDCPDFRPDGADGATDGDVPTANASKAFFDLVSKFTDAGAAAGDAIVTFDSIGVLVPRGRFDVELYQSSLKLVGQAQDFRVQYDSILRIFVLPKAHSSQVLVAICLDPPIRKGQTYYNTILCQLTSDEDITVKLDITDEALAAKNEKGAKLTREMTGSGPDVFARVLRGLSGAKLTRPGAFKDAEGEGHAVRCSYKADDGYLYPLERAFFYVQKPPLLMAYDDVDSVEFMRQSAGITAAKTFDLAVRMRGGQDHVFRGIPRSEWTNLFEWIQAKKLRVENFKEAQRGPGAGPVSYADGLGGVDPGFAGLDAQGDDDMGSGDEEEEDADFAASESSSSDDESDSDDDEEGGAKIVPEEAEKPKAKAKKRPAADEGGDEPKARKKRAKKDKDAPKKALSAFMFFSNDKREQVKADNPGIAFGEVGKKLGELWKAASAEDKAPYEAKAEEDKKRYAADMEAYRAKKGDDGQPAEAEEKIDWTKEEAVEVDD